MVNNTHRHFGEKGEAALSPPQAAEEIQTVPEEPSVPSLQDRQTRRHRTKALRIISYKGSSPTTDNCCWVLLLRQAPLQSRSRNRETETFFPQAIMTVNIDLTRAPTKPTQPHTHTHSGTHTRTLSCLHLCFASCLCVFPFVIVIVICTSGPSTVTCMRCLNCGDFFWD